MLFSQLLFFFRGFSHLLGVAIVATTATSPNALAASQGHATITVIVQSSARPDPFVVAPSQPLSLRLVRHDDTSSEGASRDVNLRYRWTGARGEPLGPERQWPSTTDSLTLDPHADGLLDQPGYLAVELRADDPGVGLNGLPAGRPVRLGMVVAAAPGSNPGGAGRLRRPDSPFAMVHPPVDDPRLGPWVKRLSWSQQPRQFAQQLAASRANGLINVPLLHGKHWRAPAGDKVPFTELHAKALRAQLDRTLDAVVAAGLALPSRWQAGLESNKGNLLARPLFHANYAAKLALVREALQARAPGQRFELVSSFTGFDFAEYQALRDGAAWPHIDVMSANLYRWRNFPMPDGWLPGVLDTLKGIAGDKPLVIGEMGIPVRGQPDPNAFFGYPAKGDAIPGATPHAVARYMVRAHVLSLASGKVERLYWYNYRNRGDSLDYAEDHFGLRAYRAKGNASHGHPLPAYASYVTMVAQLSGLKFTRAVDLADGVTGYRFEGDGARAVMVAWARETTGRIAVPAGRIAGMVRAVDLFGTPVGRTAATSGAAAPAGASTSDAPRIVEDAVLIGVEPVFIELVV